MPLINCKIELSLKWIENCVLTSAESGANANVTGADSKITLLSKLAGRSINESSNSFCKKNF